jgi:AraC-like DNA-binding protein/quercetin dioxygenase-like cupin family protein
LTPEVNSTIIPRMMKKSSRAARIEQGVHWNARHPFLCVRSTFSSRQPYAPHFHDSLSLGVVFKGGTWLRRNGETTAIRAGQMALIAPMEPHSCNPVGGRARGYHMLYIDTGWALSLLDAPPGSRLVAGKEIIDDARLFDALMRLALSVREGRDDFPGCDALAGAVAAHCSILPASGEQFPAAFSAWADGEASVEEGARALGLRRESFIRSFRRAAGVTPGQYRQSLRLIRARELLRRGRGLVETALACGYADQSHFHRMCVKYLSATPVQIKPRASLSSKK